MRQRNDCQADNNLDLSVFMRFVWMRRRHEYSFDLLLKYVNENKHIFYYDELISKTPWAFMISLGVFCSSFY